MIGKMKERVWDLTACNKSHHLSNKWNLCKRDQIKFFSFGPLYAQ